jgi:hypothetical protein
MNIKTKKIFFLITKTKKLLALKGDRLELESKEEEEEKKSRGKRSSGCELHKIRHTSRHIAMSFLYYCYTQTFVFVVSLL